MQGPVYHIISDLVRVNIYVCNIIQGHVGYYGQIFAIS